MKLGYGFSEFLIYGNDINQNEPFVFSHENRLPSLQCLNANVCYRTLRSTIPEDSVDSQMPFGAWERDIRHGYFACSLGAFSQNSESLLIAKNKRVCNA